MRVHQMTRAECEEVLGRAQVGRLACAHEGQPYIVPVYVWFDNEHLLGFSTLGRKVDWMRQNPRVCVEVEEIADTRHWTTVLVFGSYEELSKTSIAPEQQVARKRAEELLGRRGPFWEPATAKTGSHEPFCPVLYRIRISSVTGRRSARG